MRSSGMLSEGQVFLHKDDMDAPLRQTQHYSPQVIEVAGQPVHRVTKHCIAFADEALHDLQLGPLRILAGGFVGKCFVQGQPFELAELILIQGADAQVADPLALGQLAGPSGPRCPDRLFNLRHQLYDNSEVTLLRHYFTECRT
jgi:hypothetical protein